MKRTITVLIALFCLMANANFSFAMREGENEIVLRGELKPIGRSQFDPLSASVEILSQKVCLSAEAKKGIGQSVQSLKSLYL